MQRVVLDCRKDRWLDKKIIGLSDRLNQKGRDRLAKQMIFVFYLDLFILLLGLFQVVALRKPLPYARTRATYQLLQREKNIRCTPVEEADVDLKINTDVEAYMGPSSSADEMEAGCSIEDLGAVINFKDVWHYSSKKCRTRNFSYVIIEQLEIDRFTV